MSLRFFIIILFFLLFPVVAFAVTDSDNDGLTDDLEKIYYTDLNSKDSDNDGFDDFTEIYYGYSPLIGNKIKMGMNDYDKDGLSDLLESRFNTDIGKIDSDGDSYNDYEEIMNGFDPNDKILARKFSRRIEVDRSIQRLYYLINNQIMLDFPVSTGNPGSETPEGNFTILRKIDNKRYQGVGYDLTNVLWNMEFKTGFYIHAAYWHNDFGFRTHSHGCVNLKEKDAKLLYKYAEKGLEVVIKGLTPKKFIIGT